MPATPSGFRFTQGIGPALGIVGVALAFGGAFAVMVLALAVFFRTGAPVVPLMSLLTSLLMFFNPVSPRPTAIPAGCSPSCAINR